MARIRIGLLSTAAINGAILAVRGDDAPFEVVAVSSRDQARAEAYAREHGIARGRPSYDALPPVLNGREEMLGQACVLDALLRSAAAASPITL